MAREANVVVRDPVFAEQLRDELGQMIDDGARPRRGRSTGRCARGCTRRWSGSPTASSAWRWASWVTAATSGSAAAGARRRRACGEDRRRTQVISCPTTPTRRRPRRSRSDRCAARASSPARARARRRLARDRHAAAVPLGVQGPRARGAGWRWSRAKVANVGVPLLLKEIVDSLDPRDRGAGGAARAARRLRPAAPVDDAVHRAARVPVRQGDAARGARDRAQGVPPPARAVAALPPRAPDRRPDARHRARHARHLDADQLHAVLDPADAGRDRAGGGGPDRALRLDVRRDHAGGARALHRCHGARSPSGARTSAGR